MKRLISCFLVAMMAILTVTTANAVELTPSESIADDGYVTMSVEEFSQFAESQGFIVVYEDEYFPKQRMADYFVVELTNNNFNSVGVDNNLLNETARVKVVSFSTNITSVDVRFFEKHTNEVVSTYNLTAGQWSDSIDVAFLNGYELKIRGNSTSALSANNVGVVTVYWTDNEADWS